MTLILLLKHCYSLLLHKNGWHIGNDIYNGDTNDENIQILVPQVFTFDA